MSNNDNATLIGLIGRATEADTYEPLRAPTRYACSKCGNPLPSPPPATNGWTCDRVVKGRPCGGLPTRVSTDPDASVIGYTVIEFYGTGDPYFSGSADDRPLGTSGVFLRGCYTHADVASFNSRAEAQSAADRAPQRPGSTIGLIPIRDYSRA